MGVSVSVERLRVWLLVGAGLLVAVIAAFVGYAHYRGHRFLKELPKKLGADIRQETNAFTYSQSDGKKTIYTIHAAKAIQRQDGKYTLHDVGIVLYGRKQERADRIYGNEFEYDQSAGIVRAIGEVQLDLQAPAAKDAKGKMDYAAHGSGESDSVDGAAGRVIHVTTSGLVYQQKLGVAATDQKVEFEAGGIKGEAVGAEYNSDTGVLVMRSAVKMAGLERGQPVVVTASRAELDRNNQTVVLAEAKYVAVGSTAGGEQTAEARNVIAHLRSNGSVQRMDADGAVTLTNGDGGTVTAPRGVMMLNEEGHPQSAVLSGGVKYGSDEPLRQAHGESAVATATFNQAGRLEQVVLTGAVHLRERLRSTPTTWSERDLNAGAVELAVSTDRTGKSQLRDAKASGDARLQVTNNVGKGLDSSSLVGDVLTAHFVRMGNVDHLAEVHGEGHTLLRRVTAAGVVNTSSADSLEADFAPTSRVAGGAVRAKQSTDEIASATEQGHVVVTQEPAKKAGVAASGEERATAARADYDGSLKTTTLTGNVKLTDATSVLWANRVVVSQDSGDASADGDVKVSYLQPKAGISAAKISPMGAPATGEEPVHVLATRAELNHEAKVAIFYGVAGRPARLWQEASQVEAPVILFDQKKKSLQARGDGGGAGLVVHTVLTSAGKVSDTKAETGKVSVLRVASRELVYSDESREAVFSGGVQLMSTEGEMQGQQIEVYLQPVSEAGLGQKARSKTKVDAESTGFAGGSVDRMIASGHVVIDQPGRRATGERVVYTASDGMFVLTGTAGAPPKVVDEQRGTVTGTSLRFHTGDESVVVSNGGNSGAEQRVRTETRVKKNR